MADPIDIVTLNDVKAWLRVDGDYDDIVIQDLIDAATEAALATADAFDPTGEPPARLRLAIYAHVAQAFDNRTDVAAPDGNARLLGPLRSLDV